ATNSNMSIDNSMSLIVNLPNDGAHAEGALMAWKAQTSAAAINPTFSWTTSIGYAVMIASFKAAATAGQPTTRRWGGVPFMGGQGVAGKGWGGSGGGRMWGRTRTGLIVPNRLAA